MLSHKRSITHFSYSIILELNFSILITFPIQRFCLQTHLSRLEEVKKSREMEEKKSGRDRRVFLSFIFCQRRIQEEYVNLDKAKAKKVTSVSFSVWNSFHTVDRLQGSLRIPIFASRSEGELEVEKRRFLGDFFFFFCDSVSRE